MAEFEVGKEYEVTVNRFSKNYNAIVERRGNGHHINIGQVDCKPGDTVTIEFLGGHVGFCTEPEKRGGNYNVDRESGHISSVSNADSIIDWEAGDFSGGGPSNKNKLLNNLR